MVSSTEELKSQTWSMIRRAVCDLENALDNQKILNAGKIDCEEIATAVKVNRTVMGTCKPDKPSERVEQQRDKAVELLRKLVNSAVDLRAHKISWADFGGRAAGVAEDAEQFLKELGENNGN